MKKRLIALLTLTVLTLSFVLTLSSCSDSYEPVKSTEEESRTVMTLTLEGEKYEVPYELYRALFLQYKSEIDGGDAGVWTSEGKNEYVKKIDAIILDRTVEIYSTLAVCKGVGIDPYSKSFDDRIKELIRTAVEGGSINGNYYEGYDGDYDAYLASLKEMNLNYSTQELLLRYSLAKDELTTYYIGDIDKGGQTFGEIKYTEEDVRDFYFNSDSVRRVIRAFLSKDAFTEDRAQEIRDTIASKTSERDVVNYVINFSISGATDISNGELIGRYSLDSLYYSEITDSVFSLSEGETGEVIRLITDVSDGYTIIYRAEVSEEHFERCYDDAVSVYLLNEVGKILSEASKKMKDSVSYSDALIALDRSTVSMS